MKDDLESLDAVIIVQRRRVTPSVRRRQSAALRRTPLSHALHADRAVQRQRNSATEDSTTSQRGRCCQRNRKPCRIGLEIASANGQRERDGTLTQQVLQACTRTRRTRRCRQRRALVSLVSTEENPRVACLGLASRASRTKAAGRDAVCAASSKFCADAGPNKTSRASGNRLERNRSLRRVYVVS